MKVCITIDVEYPDAPCHTGNFVDLVEAAKQESVSPIFFIEGRYAKANPWIADVLKGQTIGNHGMFHVHHVFLTNRGIAESIARGEHELNTLFGKETKPLFRFPYGNVTANSLEILHGLGYKHCTWSCDSRDWEGGKTPMEILGECQQHEENTIIFHSWPDSTKGIMIPLIQGLKRLNAEFVSSISSHML